MTTPFAVKIAGVMNLPLAVSADLEYWPLVRVIWGRALGSSYQRYSSSDQCPATAGSGQEVESSQEGGGSLFSRPLDCPDCHGALGLRQFNVGNPNRLLGSCTACPSRFTLVISSDGRISPTRCPEFGEERVDPSPGLSQ